MPLFSSATDLSSLFSLLGSCMPLVSGSHLEQVFASAWFLRPSLYLSVQWSSTPVGQSAVRQIRFTSPFCHRVDVAGLAPHLTRVFGAPVVVATAEASALCSSHGFVSLSVGLHLLAEIFFLLGVLCD
jgi:hypothetical protein